MEELHAIAYKSTASPELTSQDLDRLLRDARTFNSASGVTGVLLYHSGLFFQFLEGPEPGVVAAYARITLADSHTDIVELLNGPAAERQFDSWHMGFCQVPSSELQLLAAASWEVAVPITRASFQQSEGLGLLLYYWNKWLAEPPSNNSSKPTPLRGAA